MNPSEANAYLEEEFRLFQIKRDYGKRAYRLARRLQMEKKLGPLARAQRETRQQVLVSLAEVLEVIDLCNCQVCRGKFR